MVDDQTPSDELLSFPKWWSSRPALPAAEAFAQWQAAGSAFTKIRPGEGLATMNERFSALYASVDYDEGIFTKPDLRVAWREAAAARGEDVGVHTRGYHEDGDHENGDDQHDGGWPW